MQRKPIKPLPLPTDPKAWTDAVKRVLKTHAEVIKRLANR